MKPAYLVTWGVDSDTGRWSWGADSSTHHQAEGGSTPRMWESQSSEPAAAAAAAGVAGRRPLLAAVAGQPLRVAVRPVAGRGARRRWSCASARTRALWCSGRSRPAACPATNHRHCYIGQPIIATVTSGNQSQALLHQARTSRGSKHWCRVNNLTLTE